MVPSPPTRVAIVKAVLKAVDAEERMRSSQMLASLLASQASPKLFIHHHHHHNNSNINDDNSECRAPIVHTEVNAHGTAAFGQALLPMTTGNSTANTNTTVVVATTVV